MKRFQKFLNRFNDGALLKDSVEGLIEYVVSQVAALQNRVVQLSNTDAAGDVIPASRAELDALNDDPRKLNTIPAHVHKGNKAEKRRFVFFVTLIILCESALTFYALSLMIARGDNGMGWVALRIALAGLTTALSVLAAEEFFKIYFKEKESELCEQYDISNGKVNSSIYQPGQVNDAKMQQRKNLENVERRIWFMLMLLGNMVIVLFALIRSKSIETSASIVQTIALVILSAILPVIGGLLYSKVKLLSFLIRAYVEQGRYREKVKGLRRKLNEFQRTIPKKYNDVLFEECSKVFKNIKFFEAQLNEINLKNKLPKASRHGIEFIADFNQFLSHIEHHTRYLVMMATDNSNKKVRNEFENTSKPEGFYQSRTTDTAMADVTEGAGKADVEDLVQPANLHPDTEEARGHKTTVVNGKPKINFNKN
ncbi:hypothetical protein [Pedobacter sp. P26]|uniref:hypothetical protein n=1 Tax=Pedobacter sp. P26 TaxID=3423956 RepID=UPI003D66FE0F